MLEHFTTLRFRLIAFTLLTVLLSLLLAALALDKVYSNLHEESATRHTEKVFTLFRHMLEEDERRLRENVEFISGDESLVASVNLINEYQDKHDYRPLIFDVEKKKIARELLERIETGSASHVAVYGRDGLLIAFASSHEGNSSYGFSSFRNGELFYRVVSEGGEPRTDRPPAEIRSEMPPVEPAHADGDAALVYRTRLDELDIAATASIVRLYPGGESEVVGMVETIKDVGPELVKGFSEQVQTRFAIRLSNGFWINAPGDLVAMNGFGEGLRPLFEGAGDVAEWIEHPAYFVHGRAIPSEAGMVHVFSLLPKDRLLETMQETRMTLLGIVVVVAFITLPAGLLWLTRAVSNPLHELAEHARKVEKGDYASLSMPGREDEIGFLARVIDRMVTAIHTREEALRASEQRLKTAQVIARLGDWEYGYRSGHWSISDNLVTILEISPKSDFELLDLLGRVAREDRAALEGCFERALSDYQAFECKYRILAPSGPRTLRTRCEVIRDPAGEPIRLAGATQDVTELQLAQERLDHLAHHDPLTGLANRVLFNDRLEHAIKRHGRNGMLLAVMFLDLDHFKDINDSRGHQFGDQLLRGVSDRLRSLVREQDTLARIGGDEFILLVEELHQPRDCIRIVDKILAGFREPILVDEERMQMGITVGISLYPQNGDSVVELVKNADTAMYRAKSLGRNTFQFYTQELTRQLAERLKMQRMIREAIQGDGFTLYYQPQVSIPDGRIIGAEALIRWYHPDEGTIAPDRFIPLAEQTGQIVDVGRWVLEAGLTQLARWRYQGLQLDHLSINLSSVQLAQPDTVPMIAALLERLDLDPQWLELEITESYIMKDQRKALQVLRRLRERGIRLAIDDFGTGYSSMAYLKNLPVTKLKIDRSFIKDMPEDASANAITHAIVVLGKSLGLEVIAEGVEEEAQRDFLLQQGCTQVQGYLTGRPMPADAFEMLLPADGEARQRA